jgi:hypothetical protein
MKPPKQPNPPIAGAKHEGAANVRAGVRSAASNMIYEKGGSAESRPYLLLLHVHAHLFLLSYPKMKSEAVIG